MANHKDQVATGPNFAAHAVVVSTGTSRKKGSARDIARSHHETADSYVHVVAQLHARWRVIVCKDGIQLILQRRRGDRRGRARWTGASYHLTRNSLIRVSHALCSRIDPAAMAILEALPDRIGGAA